MEFLGRMVINCTEKSSALEHKEGDPLGANCEEPLHIWAAEQWDIEGMMYSLNFQSF